MLKFAVRMSFKSEGCCRFMREACRGFMREACWGGKILPRLKVGIAAGGGDFRAFSEGRGDFKAFGGGRWDFKAFSLDTAVPSGFKFSCEI